MTSHDGEQILISAPLARGAPSVIIQPLDIGQGTDSSKFSSRTLKISKSCTLSPEQQRSPSSSRFKLADPSPLDLF